jgi:sec-independent protein translocase protein TatC
MPVEKIRKCPWDHIERASQAPVHSVGGADHRYADQFFLPEKVIDISRSRWWSYRLQSIEVTENIGVFMRVSLLCGVILALPVILYEILAFIVPG